MCERVTQSLPSTKEYTGKPATCPVCNRSRMIAVFPWHCCVRIDTPNANEHDTEGHRKAAICRSNACGRYDQATDTCGMITATGRPGQVGYLLSHPQVGCVAKEPLF